MSKEPQEIKEILEGISFLKIKMKERRGRKQKYFFYDFQKGEIRKKIVPLSKARCIQTAMKNAANAQGIDVEIQNFGHYLLIKRKK